MAAVMLASYLPAPRATLPATFGGQRNILLLEERQ
jgi:hypothetical protein